MSQPDQTGVVRFLEGPMAYTPAPPCVERLETHGALVFLAGDVALKIKKSLRFSYMDFSTLELRRRACLRELEINRPHAPDIYLDVVAITREVGDRLAIGGRGEPVEWCVRMRRFAQSDLLSAKAEAGELDPGLCHRLAEAVLAYHRTAPRIAVADSGDRLARIADDICRQLLAHAPSLGSADVDRLGEQLRRHLLMTKPILSMRDRNGFVRRVHGDLHLGNIVLWKGAPVLFDAIEFDEEIATIDTLYDLAFLLMDLDHRGQRPAANRILNHYLWRSDDVADLEALAAMPLFLALRAGVRSMVLAQRAQQEKAAPRQDDLARARRYLLRAIEYLAPVEPILVAVGGLSGTGKSTLAARLAPKLGAAPGALHLRSDLERKALFGAAETEPLPAAAYSPEAGARVYAALLVKAASALRAGHAVIADAVFGQQHERDAIEQTARSLGAEFHGVWLQAPPETLRDRVGRRRGDASDADAAVVDRQLTYDVGAIHWARLASGGPLDDLQEAAMALLGKPLPPASA